MARLFIVDDDADNARLLCCCLQQVLPGHHDILCFSGLAEYRQERRRQPPDLILVELLRHRSNGFTLAAALARQSAAPVVLLTDRDQPSDRLWAAARGVRYVLGRQRGLQAMSSQIAGLLAADSLPAVAGGADFDSRMMPPAILWPQLCVSPQTALLNVLAAELQQLPCPAPASHRQRLSYDNLLHYVSDHTVCQALQTFSEQAAPRCVRSRHRWLQAREQLLLRLQPAAHRCLLTECEQEWTALWPVMQQGDGRAGSNSTRFYQLQHALMFLPPAHAASVTEVAADPATDAATETVTETATDLAARIRSTEQILVAGSGATGWQTIVAERCRPMLASLSSGQYPVASALRDLAELALVLRTVTEPARWQAVLDDCLNALYDTPSASPVAVTEQWLRHVVTLTGCSSYVAGRQKSPDAGATANADTANAATANAATANAATANANANAATVDADASLSSATALKLQQVLSDINRRLLSQKAFHARMIGVMVSVYKLRSWLWLQREQCADDLCSPARWRLVIACLYQLSCHGVLQGEQLTPDEMADLVAHVQHLLHCSQQHRVPSMDTVRNLAALELTLARRLQHGAGAEHRLLAAGLHRLPVPDSIVADLLSDTRWAGTVLSEITHELILLTEGARRLGVVRVESLARLLLDCYQQLAIQPDRLQHKPLRLALGKAHRVLCRLLDQAAAWLPLDQDTGGPSVTGAINDLFTQFDFHGIPATSGLPDSARHESAPPLLLQQYLLINRQLRQLLRRPGDLSAYRSLISELLREQQALIAPYLRYQSPG